MDETLDSEKSNLLGNEFFSTEDYSTALQHYMHSHKLTPSEPRYISNIAFALTKLKQYRDAVTYCNKLIKLRPDFAKAYYRRGFAHLELGECHQAQADLRRVLELCPKDLLAQKQLQRALYSGFFTPVSEYEYIFSLSTPANYAGPVYEGPSHAFLKDVIAWYLSNKDLDLRSLLRILFDGRTLLEKSTRLARIDAPRRLLVVGDTHGQFTDLVRILEKLGDPTEDSAYVFNGDFVDRGKKGLEVVTTLVLYKLIYTNRVYLIRGNHETRELNMAYGFFSEVRAKYPVSYTKVFDTVHGLFDALPLCAVANSSVFIVHGGLPIHGLSLAELEGGAVTEETERALLWADPTEEREYVESKRGAGYDWGTNVTDRFLEENGLRLIVRSHEAIPGGVKYNHDRRVVTVFSAPDYMATKNVAAVLELSRELEQTVHYIHPTTLDSEIVKEGTQVEVVS